MKIQQMAFMLVAVFIFFMLAGLFFLMIQSQEWEREANLLEKNKATELARFLAESAEFSCGAYCIDADRAMMIKKRAAYSDFWGVKSIEIRTIYPKNEKEILCTESSYPNCNLIKIIEDKENSEKTASSPVALCKRTMEKNYVYYKCEIARLIIGYDVK